MTAPCDWIGFHIVRPTPGSGEWPRAAIEQAFERALGLRPVAFAPPPWERLIFGSESDADPLTLHVHGSSHWTECAVRPITRERFILHGAAAFAQLFESLCVAVGAHLARTVQQGGWALVTPGELAGNVDALDWLQYVGPRFASCVAQQKPSQHVSARALPQGGTIVRLDVDPFEGAWRTRRDAAFDLGVQLRPFHALVQAELTAEQRLREVLPPAPPEWPARLAVWFGHYGREATLAALRAVARIHMPFDAIALEGCVKMVSWGGDHMPLAKRELLTQSLIDVPEMAVPQFARNASDPRVVAGMMNLTMAHISHCRDHPQCEWLRDAFARIDAGETP